MRIQGLQKLTLLDYPGKVACTVFTAGCNFRCPFCHNASLVMGELQEPEITEEAFFSFLKKRQGILDGVCVTGGEPLLQKEIELFLTHGHEDHIGAIPYVLRQINPPIYGTRLTLGILKNKLSEHTLPSKPDLRCVEAGDTVKLGALSVEFIHVNHSIADACALAIGTPVGTVIHSGDLKIDVTPIDGEMIDLTRFGELGRRGVLLFMCESTNAERQGHSPSEKSVGRSLEYIFTLNSDKRIIIATFSSNDVEHTASRDCDLSGMSYAGVDYLLDSVNV